MEINLSKYFAGELDEKQKSEFLLEVINNIDLKEDFVENHHLMLLLNSFLRKDDQTKALAGLYRFMQKVRKSSIS